MILVQNHQQPLSGNKLLLTLAFCTSILFTSCSKRVKSSYRNRSKTSELSKKAVTVETIADGQIMLFLPFNLSSYRRGQERLVQSKEILLSLQYYKGIKIALDSAAKRYEKTFKLFVFDTDKGKNYLDSIALSADFKRNNLIIGPANSEDISQILSYAKLYNIPIVLPFSTKPIAEWNSSLQMTPITPVEIYAHKIVSDICSKSNSVTVYIIQPNKSENSFFISFLSQELKMYSNEHAKVKEIKAIQWIDKKVSAGTDSVLNIVIATARKRDVIKILSDLKYGIESLKQYKSINIYAHHDWQNVRFASQHRQWMYRNNIKLTSYYCSNAASTQEKDFARNCKIKYKALANKHLYSAFDLGMCLFPLVAQYGSGWVSNISHLPYQGIRYKFDFVSDATNGFYNQTAFFLRYNKQGQLEKVQ